MFNNVKNLIYNYKENTNKEWVYESKKSDIDATDLEEVDVYKNLAVALKIMFDLLEQRRGVDIDVEDRVKITTKLFRKISQKPSLIRKEFRGLMGAKTRTVSRNLFLDLL